MEPAPVVEEEGNPPPPSMPVKHTSTALEEDENSKMDAASGAVPVDEDSESRTTIEIPVVPWLRQLSFVLRKNYLLMTRRPILLMVMVRVCVFYRSGKKCASAFIIVSHSFVTSDNEFDHFRFAFLGNSRGRQ